MNLQQIFERVVLTSGQFQISTDCIELDATRFKTLVEMVLGTYNKYSPISTRLFKDLNSSRQYTFTESNTPADSIKMTNGQTLPFAGAPAWIAEIIPVRIAGVYPYFLREYDRPNSNLNIKTEYPWEYRNPTLTTGVQGQYDIQAIYHHKLIKTVSISDETLYSVPTISDVNDDFFKVLSGRFLQGLGRSRRAFTMTDLPIQSDASELVSDGKDMEKDGLQEMQDNARIQLAWR